MIHHDPVPMQSQERSLARTRSVLLALARTAALSAGLLLCHAGAVSLAQTQTSVSTYNVAHEVSFQYPSSWDVALDSTHISNNPQAMTYQDSQAIDIVSPDAVAEITLYMYSDSDTALQDLQSLYSRDAADPNGHPNFQVVTAASPVQVTGADDAAIGEYVYTDPDGALEHYVHLLADRDGTHYDLQIILADSQLAQYQSDVGQILSSFQLLP